MNINASIIPGNKCTRLASMDRCEIYNSAVCVNQIHESSGSFTSTPSFVLLLSTHSLSTCKKCPVVSESAIANSFWFWPNNAAAYEYLILVSLFIFEYNLLLHKLMFSVTRVVNTLLFLSLTCDSYQETRLRLFRDPLMLFSNFAS